MIEAMRLIGSKLDEHVRLFLFQGKGKRLLVRYKVGHSAFFYWEKRGGAANQRFRMAMDHYKASKKSEVTDAHAKFVLFRAEADRRGLRVGCKTRLGQPSIAVASNHLGTFGMFQLLGEGRTASSWTTDPVKL